jgi:hypothetical protein
MEFIYSSASDKYHLPTKRFLRYSSDVEWMGWIYWSFIMLIQRQADGAIMENGWTNAPVYAVEINLNPETCYEPQIIVAKFEYNDMSNWNTGCSPANFDIFYNPIHKHVDIFQGVEKEVFEIVTPTSRQKQKVADKYWSLKKVTQRIMLLTDVTDKTAYDMVFGTIEKLSIV